MEWATPTTTRALDTFVKRLRQKIEDDPAHPCRLRTVRHVGYIFDVEPGITMAARSANRTCQTPAAIG